MCLTVNSRQPTSKCCLSRRREKWFLEPRGEQMSPGSGPGSPNPWLGRASGATWLQDRTPPPNPCRRSILRGPHFLEFLEKGRKEE